MKVMNLFWDIVLQTAALPFNQQLVTPDIHGVLSLCGGQTYGYKNKYSLEILSFQNELWFQK
jgi:hypothetical protein